MVDLEAPISAHGAQAQYGSAQSVKSVRSGNSASKYYQAVAVFVAVAICCIVGFVALSDSFSGPFSLEQSDAQKALSIEMSKRKYDQAKKRVASLHEEFDALKKQLQNQVKSLDAARGDLVTQIKAAEGNNALTKNLESSSESEDLGDSDFTAPYVRRLRDAALAATAAGTSSDAADAAKHALSYTQQVASRVGDLADESEKQATKIVDAARLTQEAKDAMRAALEQSSQIVDYNTHAAQAVAQDSGFVTTAAQSISGYLHNIFHDSQAVHEAAIASVEHMNQDVTAADHAVSEIEADAREAYDVLKHISEADKAATGFAKHARAAAITAATAANGALKGEKAAMVGGLKAIASAHSAKAGAQAAMEYARAAQAAVHPYVYGQVPLDWGTRPQAAPAAPQPAPAEVEAPVAEAKELVDSVVVLMQQLTNALETYGTDCEKVKQILTYYQAQMGAFHAQGVGLAGKIDDADMNLIEQYAQTRVASFASKLESAVRVSATECSLPISAFIPDASIGMTDKPANEAKLKMLRQAAAVKKAAQKKSGKRMGKADLDKAVEHEQQRIKELRAQVAELKAQKAKLSKK